VQFLAKRAKPDGTIDEGPDGLPYPVYTAALTVQVLYHPEFKDDRSLDQARQAWLKYLLDRQLSEENGWDPDDKHYAGWGYYPGIPKKPAPGQVIPAQHLLESNISATVFALDAIWAARPVDPAFPILHIVYTILRRLQNADGGFRFIADDPVRNKAGKRGDGPNGEPEFHSYGSATADGFRALIICKYLEFNRRKPNDPTLTLGPCRTDDGGAAGRWLLEHFAADKHPGTYVPAHEPNRNAVYFYYARSVAKTFRPFGFTEVNGRHWAESLSEALLAKQRPDGSWANPVDLVRENDPVVATAYAVSALAECRKALAK
jgi:hypothetical protein